MLLFLKNLFIVNKIKCGQIGFMWRRKMAWTKYVNVESISFNSYRDYEVVVKICKTYSKDCTSLKSRLQWGFHQLRLQNACKLNLHVKIWGYLFTGFMPQRFCNSINIVLETIFALNIYFNRIQLSILRLLLKVIILGYYIPNLNPIFSEIKFDSI